ncbi:MAG: class I SAM-dependent methyltransferase [Taibaiella sp.]|nr:class I SAM-dependent methyltransferase [Taibaiella sp.]
MQDFWNERYNREEYVYGEAPNEYFRQQLQTLTPGSILMPLEGEGRNGVYAAGLGWQVDAFDMSTEGKRKALQLAKKNNVTINYTVGELSGMNYKPEAYDAMALVFAHFPAEKKEAYHSRLNSYLRKGGIVILEAFNKKHIQYNSVNPLAGGPRDVGMLYNEDELRTYFKDFDIIELYETDTMMEEGAFHKGMSAVVRLTAQKR